MKKVWKLGVLVLSLFILTAQGTQAELNTGGSGGFSIVENNGEVVTVLTLSPTIGIGNFKAGLDINIFTPANNKPDNVPAVSLRFIEYDDGSNGLRYGILSNITLGYGLIMDDYTTEVEGTTIFDPRQAGVKFYTSMFHPFTVVLMGTNSQVYAERLIYCPPDVNVMGVPLVLGQTYAIDTNGVDVNGTTIGKGQAAIAVDAGLPVFEDAGTVFVEVAQLNNYSKGLMTGFKGRLLGLIDYQIDYRMFGSKFVPGYFNYQYEVNPVSLASLNAGRISGYHGGLGFNLGQFAYFKADYEDYMYEGAVNSDASLKAELAFTDGTVEGKLQYAQPKMKNASSITSDGATIIGDVYVPTSYLGLGFPGKVRIGYKAYYDANGDLHESQEIGYKISF